MKLDLLLFCVVVVSVWVASDMMDTAIRAWSAEHSVASAVGLSALLLGAGSAGFFANSAVRRRRIPAVAPRAR